MGRAQANCYVDNTRHLDGVKREANPLSFAAQIDFGGTGRREIIGEV